MTSTKPKVGRDPGSIGAIAFVTVLIVLLFYSMLRPGGFVSLLLTAPQESRKTKAAYARIEQERFAAQTANAAKADKVIGEIISDIHDKSIKKRVKAWQTLADAARNYKNGRAREALLEALREGNFEAVQAAYYFYVAEGVPGSENLLISALSWRDPQWDDALTAFEPGTAEFSSGITCSSCLAEAYLNSGNAKLDAAARDWAKGHNYKIKYTGQTGGLRWGSH